MKTEIIANRLEKAGFSVNQLHSRLITVEPKVLKDGKTPFYAFKSYGKAFDYFKKVGLL